MRIPFFPPHRFTETLFLGISSLICFGLSIFRLCYTDTKVFLFLNWNLFLAFVPWALSSLVMLKPNLQANKWVVFSLLFVWLLFFPNAPYILTDLFHLRHNGAMPIWFDLVLILSFAWTGLLFGFFSLLDIEKILKTQMPKLKTSMLIVFLLFLTSFGIYLGRYLRWNSWDIISQPMHLFYDIIDRFANPLAHPRTWGLTLFLGLFLNMVYWSFKIIRKREG